jgi:hypothetical protein
VLAREKQQSEAALGQGRREKEDMAREIAELREQLYAE